MPCCWAPTETAATSSRPPAAAAASLSAVHHAAGSTSVPSGCVAEPDRTISPVSASRTTVPSGTASTTSSPLASVARVAMAGVDIS